MLSIEYRYFYQSALDSSIRKASQNLNINSSAIVRQIQKLEDRLQTKLFIRNARGLELTEEGKLLFDHLSIQNETNQNFLINLKQNKTSTSGEQSIPIGKLHTYIVFSVLGKFLAKEIPKSVLFVIRLSIIVSGCLEDILILTSGYTFLNLEIIGDKN